MTDYPFLSPQSGLLTHVQNPVTRSEIRLNPPFRFEDEEHLNSFLGHIEEYCVSAWNLGRLDPADIDAPYGWVDASVGYFSSDRHVLPAPEDIA